MSYCVSWLWFLSSLSLSLSLLFFVSVTNVLFSFLFFLFRVCRWLLVQWVCVFCIVYYVTSIAFSSLWIPLGCPVQQAFALLTARLCALCRNCVYPSAKEFMSLPVSVCLSVRRIAGKFWREFWWNFLGGVRYVTSIGWLNLGSDPYHDADF